MQRALILPDDAKLLKNKVDALTKENEELPTASAEQDQYKCRWGLRLSGLPETDGENIRGIVIDIIGKVCSISPIQHLPRCSGYTVSEIRERRRHRQVIIMFALRNVGVEVWRAAKLTPICKEMGISFAEDLSKRNRNAFSKLWPQVDEARRGGRAPYCHWRPQGGAKWLTDLALRVGLLIQ